MNTKIISVYSRMKGMLDDKYTLYENGDVVNKFDANIYPGNQNLKRMLKAKDLQKDVKEALLENAKEENRVLVKTLLNL